MAKAASKPKVRYVKIDNASATSLMNSTQRLGKQFLKEFPQPDKGAKSTREPVGGGKGTKLKKYNAAAVRAWRKVNTSIERLSTDLAELARYTDIVKVEHVIDGKIVKLSDVKKKKKRAA